MTTKDLLFTIIPSLLFLTPSLHILIAAYPIKFSAINNAIGTPGGERYEEVFGPRVTISIMANISKTIWKVFQQPTDEDKKYVPHVTTIIIAFTGDAWAYMAFPNIMVSASRLASFPKEWTKDMFTGLMVHEMTHVFQWNGDGTAPGWLTEGFAEYVKVKAGYGTTDNLGDGQKWDEGYGVTARFLEYCDSLKPSFAPDLNKKMRKVFKEEYFQDMLGKPVNQLWEDYKAKYGKSSITNYVSMVSSDD